MRTTFRIGTGSAPSTEHLEPGEGVFDPNLRRFGIGIGGQTPAWYPAIDINGHLSLLSGQRITAQDNDSSIALGSSGPVVAYKGYNITTFVGVDASVNGVSIANAITSEAPTISAVGSDTNIELRLASQGSSGVALATATNKVQAKAVHNAAAVNYVTFKGSAANTAVTLSADGASSTIDLKLEPKGPGYVQLASAFSASADAAVTGYIRIKDASGTIRKLAIIS
jgi:hypothetical protein